MPIRHIKNPMLFAKTTLALSLAAVATASPLSAVATATQAASTARLLGTVSAINGNNVSIKSDAGVVSTVTVDDKTKLVRTAPGQKDLTGATAIQVQDLAVGDRVLVRATPGTAENTYTAQAVIAMKQGDIAQKQTHEREDWQKRGVGGIVKSVDTAGKTIIITAGAKTWTIQLSPSTVVRRYAPDSVKFDDAKISSLDQIKVGDQLRARGDHNADGTQIAAEEIVAGSFRNIAGTVVSVDAGNSSVTVTDLATKTSIIIRVTPDSQLHKLSPETAQRIAGRLKGDASGEPSNQPAASDNGQSDQHSGDLSQLLQRAPALQISDLHKGDAVMIVSTSGAANAVTAITLLAGVEPMLQASTKASQSLFSSSWSLGSGGNGDAGGAAQQ